MRVAGINIGDIDKASKMIELVKDEEKDIEYIDFNRTRFKLDSILKGRVKLSSLVDMYINQNRAITVANEEIEDTLGVMDMQATVNNLSFNPYIYYRLPDEPQLGVIFLNVGRRYKLLSYKEGDYEVLSRNVRNTSCILRQKFPADNGLDPFILFVFDSADSKFYKIIISTKEDGIVTLKVSYRLERDELKLCRKANNKIKFHPVRFRYSADIIPATVVHNSFTKEQLDYIEDKIGGRIEEIKLAEDIGGEALLEGVLGHKLMRTKAIIVDRNISFPFSIAKKLRIEYIFGFNEEGKIELINF